MPFICASVGLSGEGQIGVPITSLAEYNNLGPALVIRPNLC